MKNSHICVILKLYYNIHRKYISKIFFKVNNKKADDVEKENAEIPVTENTAVATEPAPEQKKSDEPVQIALFPEDEQRDAVADDTSANMGKEPFDKEKIVKYFKRHPKKTINSKVGRFSPKLNKGLTQSQVETRFRQFLFNDTNKKYSRSYASIFIGNAGPFLNCWGLLGLSAWGLQTRRGFRNFV